MISGLKSWAITLLLILLAASSAVWFVRGLQADIAAKRVEITNLKANLAADSLELIGWQTVVGATDTAEARVKLRQVSDSLAIILDRYDLQLIAYAQLEIRARAMGRALSEPVQLATPGSIFGARWTSLLRSQEQPWLTVNLDTEFQDDSTLAHDWRAEAQASAEIFHVDAGDELLIGARMTGNFAGFTLNIADYVIPKPTPLICDSCRNQSIWHSPWLEIPRDVGLFILGWRLGGRDSDSYKDPHP